MPEVVHLDILVGLDFEVILREAGGSGVVEDVAFFVGGDGRVADDVADGGEEVVGHCGGEGGIALGV